MRSGGGRKVRTLTRSFRTVKIVRANSPPQQCERCEQKRPEAKAEGEPNPKLVGSTPR